jgi:hypothetical protein
MPSPVQSAPGSATSGTTVTVTLPNPTGTGHSLLVYIGESQDTTNPVVASCKLGGVADNFGSSAVVSNVNNAECNSEIWLDSNCKAGQTVVLVTFTAGTGTSQANAVWVEEWPYILTKDKRPAGTGSSTGSATTFTATATGTLGSPNEIIAGTVTAEATAPVLTGPTTGTWVNNAQITPVAAVGMIASHEVVTSTATQIYTGGINSGAIYGCCAASFTYVTAAASYGTVRTSPLGRARAAVRSVFAKGATGAPVTPPVITQAPPVLGPLTPPRPVRPRTAAAGGSPGAPVVPPPPVAATFYPSRHPLARARLAVRSVFARGAPGAPVTPAVFPRAPVLTSPLVQKRPQRRPRPSAQGSAGATVIPPTRNLLVSVAGVAGSDKYGNEWPAGIQVGAPGSGPQVQLLPDVNGAAQLSFPLGAGVPVTPPNVAGGYGSGVGGLELSGPQLQAPGLNDWVQVILVSDSSGGSGAQAQFNYIDASGAVTLVGTFYAGGWNLNGQVNITGSLILNGTPIT